MARKAPAVKLTQDFLDTVTALLHTPPMPKDKRKKKRKAKKASR